VEELLNYCKDGDVGGVRRLLTFGAADVVGAKNSIGGTGLHWAAYKGRVGVAALLIENNADLEAKDDNGWTPMFFAKTHGKDEVVKLLEDAKKRQPLDVEELLNYCKDGDVGGIRRLLLTFGAADIVGEKNLIGGTGLHWAARLGRVGVAALLIENNADLEAKDDGGLTPRDLATSLEVVKLLEDVKKRQSGTDGNWNFSAVLFKYCCDGDVEGVRRLLLTCGAANVVGAKNSRGWKGLHFAAYKGGVGVAALLIENNTDLEAEDDGGRTPMDKAKINGREEIVKLL
jgi:ankyrin repeat protein